MKINFNLGIEIVLYLNSYRINGLLGVYNGKSGTASFNRDSQRSKRQAYFARATQVWLAMSITTPV